MLNVMSPQAVFSSDALYHTPGVDADALLQPARFRMLLLGAVLGGWIAWWAWQLGGKWAAAVATTLFCLDPNFLAHAPLMKNDVAMTLLFVVLMLSVRQIGKRITILRLLLVGLLLGAALTTKFSGVLAVPMIGVSLVGRALLPEPWTIFRRTVHERRSKLLAAVGVTICSMLIAWPFIWLCYGLRFSPTPHQLFSMNPALHVEGEHEVLLGLPPDQIPTPQQMEQWTAQWKPGIFIRLILAVDQYKLLPQAWTFAFLNTHAWSLARLGFLCGRTSIRGWWYYFPLAILFKTPLATLLAIVVAVAVGFMSIRRQRVDWWNLISLLTAPAIYFAIAMRTHVNIGVRHVFPIYPFIFILVGLAAATAMRRWPRRALAAVAALSLCLVAETVSAYPEYIPFFNMAAGGATGGLALLGDSNLDWGQELPALAQWMRAHPDRQLCLGYFGTADPKYYHLDYVLLPIGNFGLPNPDQTHINGLQPVIALSAVALQGYVLTPAQFQVYAPFQQQQPIAILGGSMYLFDPLKPEETP